jgi:integral membrane protein (TIGR01906 family)
MRKGAAMRDKFLFGLSVLWVIAAAVVLTILLAIPLFALEIHWYNLAELAQVSAATIWHNFLVLLNYLLNPFVGQLKMPDFPSSASGLKHFSEVKNLFMIALALAFVLIPVFVLLVKEKLVVLFRNGLKIAMGAPIFLAVIAILIGFDQFFVIFHEILFRDNTWLFDPNFDPIINVLPEQYFMHTFLIFILIYEIIFGLLYLQSHRFIKKIR